MRNHLWKGVLLGFLFSTISGGSSLEAASGGNLREAYAPKVGQVHPDFTLPNVKDGRAVSLSDFRGKKVLLIQMASW